ncbi:hypothetical protein DPMN_001658 [Dreissena polymorpha]|uniref:Uncharacterized protein n=1 Tax=Dreissena polymorpha TaxID=45954 RepID=A0A9D4MKG5_DREPO|nr:hypothetical protein DPMN_001658 [Dreissena polymorpha]
MAYRFLRRQRFPARRSIHGQTRNGMGIMRPLLQVALREGNRRASRQLSGCLRTGHIYRVTTMIRQLDTLLHASHIISSFRVLVQ